MRSLLSNVEPGSLVVIKSNVPNQPGQEMVQVMKFTHCGYLIFIDDSLLRCSWFHPRVKVQL